METPTVLAAALLGLLVGAVASWLLLRARYAVPLAAASAERDLGRDGVADLQSSAAADSEVAALVGPLRDSLGRVEEQVHALERDRVAQFSRVALELARVQSSTDGLRDQTASLVGSLSSANVRGSWGEVALRRVLEHSGLLHRCDFDTQWSGRNQHGAPVRPDVVVHLPGGRHIAVDAKAPMTGFLSAAADGLDPAVRDGHLRAHAKALRGHVAALAAKDYWSALDCSPEFVVCFLPGESFLSAALAADPALHEHAMARQVVLVSPATLLALLRTVALTWQQDSLAQGARELLALGHDLYARIGAVARHTDAVGAALRRSVEAYNGLVGSMESRVLVTARRIHELGLTRDAPPTLQPITATPRPLTAVELIGALHASALDADVARPDLVDPSLRDSPAPESGPSRAAG
jgi:DNA recombination protein RmuC